MDPIQDGERAVTDLGTIVYPTLALWQIALDGVVVAENLLGKDTGVGITSYEGLGLPDQRTADQDLPSDHGVVALGDFHMARTITFELCITGDGCTRAEKSADAWTQLRILTGVWQARQADVTLELCMTDGTTYVMLGRPRRFEADTDGLRVGSVMVAAQFLATDPRMYAVVTSGQTVVYDIASGQAGGLCLTDTPNGGGAAQVLCLTDTPDGGGAAQVLCAQPRTTGEMTVTNIGNTDTYPTTTFFGPVVNPQILNITTGRTLAFVATLILGDALEVNHRTRVIRLNGVPAPSLLGPNADFWPLIPGDNEIHFVHAGGTSATATINWRPAWL